MEILWFGVEFYSLKGLGDWSWFLEVWGCFIFGGLACMRAYMLFMSMYTT